MQQDNNIENKLRHLDKLQQPDVSNMEDHWQQMQFLLAPSATPVTKGLSVNGFIGAVISILLLAGFVFLHRSLNNGDKNNGNIANGNIAVNEKTAVPVMIPVKDTMEKKSMPAGKSLNNKTISRHKAKNNNYLKENDSVFADIKINFSPCETCPAKKADSVNRIADREMLLQNLLAQLKKEAQQFLIDNSRDTLFRCAEGSLLLVPANSLGGKSGIVFSVKEFYKESDIVLNQLSTVSNKNQLVSGGMLQIKATLNGNDVTIDPSKPLRLFMTDTSSNMNEMQLFNGESNAPANTTNTTASFAAMTGDTTGASYNTAPVNWIPQYQYFSRKKIISEVRVLNIIDQPYRVKQKRKGEIGYFIFDEDSLKMDKETVRQLLKEKYGYYKVRLRSGIHNWFESSTGRAFNRDYATVTGDSVWMDTETADRYSLKGTATRQVVKNEISTYGNNVYYRLSQQSGELLKTIQNRYCVDITKLGWINCDRFYNDPAEKLRYAVNLAEPAKNYYTVLLFDNIKSMMNGYADGNRVIFDNVPKGAKVKVISIGINRSGSTVYTLQSATISRQGLTGLKFESTSVPGLKTSLSKIDW